MLVELLPYLVAKGFVARYFSSAVDRCYSRYFDDLAGFECCRYCDSSRCVPCVLDPAVQQARQRFHDCLFRVWCKSLLKAVPAHTADAIVQTLVPIATQRCRFRFPTSVDRL